MSALDSFVRLAPRTTGLGPLHVDDHLLAIDSNARSLTADSECSLGRRVSTKV